MDLKLDHLLQTTARTLLAEKRQSDAELVRTARATSPDLEHASFLDSFEIHFEIPPEQFAALGRTRADTEKRIHRVINAILAGDFVGCGGVLIKPSVEHNPGWRSILHIGSGEDAPSASEADDRAALHRSLQRQIDLMQEVATGGRNIREVDDEYKDLWLANHQSLESWGIPDPNEFRGLWDWYNRWSKPDLPTYKSRRAFLGNLYKDCLAALLDPKRLRTEVEPTGWGRVDRQASGMLASLKAAQHAEDFQNVGLQAREVLISLAHEVYRPEYPTEDGKAPSPNDAKRRLGAFFDAILKRPEARKVAKAAFDLAVATQHTRTATFRDAALCAEATASVVRMANIIAREERHRKDQPIGLDDAS